MFDGARPGRHFLEVGEFAQLAHPAQYVSAPIVMGLGEQPVVYARHAVAGGTLILLTAELVGSRPNGCRGRSR